MLDPKGTPLIGFPPYFKVSQSGTLHMPLGHSPHYYYCKSLTLSELCMFWHKLSPVLLLLSARGEEQPKRQ